MGQFPSLPFRFEYVEIGVAHDDGGEAKCAKVLFGGQRMSATLVNIDGARVGTVYLRFLAMLYASANCLFELVQLIFSLLQRSFCQLRVQTVIFTKANRRAQIQYERLMPPIPLLCHSRFAALLKLLRRRIFPWHSLDCSMANILSAQNRTNGLFARGLSLLSSLVPSAVRLGDCRLLRIRALSSATHVRVGNKPSP